MTGEEDYDAEWGVSIGPMMKGVFVDGDILGWGVNASGRPHHDDVDPDSRRDLQLSNFKDFISIVGSDVPLESPSEVLHFFSGYTNDTELEVDLNVKRTAVDFDFNGTVGQFKTFFKQHPPPYTDDYEDGFEDVDFLADYAAWARKTKEKKTARSILGRGGRDDVWQEDDADTSKSFSVYNPKRKRRR